MFSTRTSLTTLSMLMLAISVGKLQASQSITITADCQNKYTETKQNYDRRVVDLNSAYKNITDVPSVNKILKNGLLSQLKDMSIFIKDTVAKFTGEEFQLFLRLSDTEIKTQLIQSLEKMQAECQARYNLEAAIKTPNRSSPDNLELILKELAKTIAEVKAYFKVETQPAANTTAPAPIDPALQAQAAGVVDRMGKPRPAQNIAASSAAHQAASFQFTKKHWAFLCLGLIAVGGMTLGQTKYQAFTRLFGRMPEKVIVPQLSWWGWFFKKAIFWR